jgi:IS30 family transposase
LARKKRKRQGRGYSRKHTPSHIPARVSVALRPTGTQNRSCFGPWEAVAMVSRQIRPLLQMTNERKARYTQPNKPPKREAPSMRKTLNKAVVHLLVESSDKETRFPSKKTSASNVGWDTWQVVAHFKGEVRVTDPTQ